MCISRSALLLPLWIPAKGILLFLDYIGRRFPNSMAKLVPVSSFDLTVNRVLSYSAPYFFVGDPVMPLSVEYVLETSVYKGL